MDEDELKESGFDDPELDPELDPPLEGADDEFEKDHN